MKLPALRLCVLALAAPLGALAQSPAPAPAEAAAPTGPVLLHVDAAKVVTKVSPTLYGLMTEEINYSYDGGLYAELIRNRTFQDNAEQPEHWTLVQGEGATGAIELDREKPLNAQLPVALKLTAPAPNATRVGVANDGFWGIPIRSATRYQVSFYARAAADTRLTVSLESPDYVTTYASAEITGVSGGEWKQYTAELTTAKMTEAVKGRFVISTKTPGVVWLNLVSVFPPTWHDRRNGNRPDIMQLLADMHPRFLRFPGGNYLQGRTLETRFQWKKTLGKLADRPGHLNDSWKYRSSDGMGLLEFLCWCEDLKMEPVLGVFAGFTLRGVPTQPGPALEPFVQEALEEIEYVIGDKTTTWGARRIADGHPAPFPLTYVEVGNEDFFDRDAKTYDGRYKQFYEAIKAKYPQLQIIATTPVKGIAPDVVDEHFYPRQAEVFEADATRYDSYDRKGPKIFVGEWATRIGSPTPNLLAAIGDAAWMTGMERNSDLVVMHCYAPLFVNVNPGGMQWGTDLIGYDALTSYGSPSYYAQQMFASNVGDEVIGTTADNNPTREWQPATPRNGTAPAKKSIPAIFHVATRDTKTGTIYLKLVNTVATPQALHIDVSGAARIQNSGTAITLTSANSADTNTLAEPTKIVPVTTQEKFAPTFDRTLAPFSITVLKIATK